MKTHTTNTSTAFCARNLVVTTIDLSKAKATTMWFLGRVQTFPVLMMDNHQEQHENYTYYPDIPDPYGNL